MPKPGWMSITVPDRAMRYLKSALDRENQTRLIGLSMSSYVIELLEEAVRARVAAGRMDAPSAPKGYYRRRPEAPENEASGIAARGGA